MAGRIREESIAEVREKARIDEVVVQYVTLSNAGGGSHEGALPLPRREVAVVQRQPRPRFFHCFGCGEGGDVIDFLHEDRRAVASSRRSSGSRTSTASSSSARRATAARTGPRGPQRGKLIEAQPGRAGVLRRAAADPRRGAGPAVPHRARLRRPRPRRRSGSGSRRARARRCSSTCGQRGFSADEVVAAAVSRPEPARRLGRTTGSAAGCCGRSARRSGETIGFGARRIFDDDRIEAKYLNTPETHRSTRRAGCSTASTWPAREMGRSSQAVVVEGYTDVMACHLAGVKTAVASCGTAFGDEHAKVLRRLLADHEEFRGEVIFTFDGDAAGQKAAIKAFEGDQNFVSQTYVAVEPDGLDPCDLRIKKGDAAVRELVARRVPLYRFVARQRRLQVRPRPRRRPGRRPARDARGWWPRIRDQSKVTAFAQEISRMIGAEVDTNAVLAEVRRATGSGPRARPRPGRGRGAAARAAQPRCPTCATRASRIERETLKLVAPAPDGRSAGPRPTSAPDDFTHPTYRAVWDAGRRRRRSRSPGADDHGWSARSARRARSRPGRGVGGQRAGGRAAAHRKEPDGRLRRAARRPAARAHGAAPDRRRSSRSCSAPTRSSTPRRTTGCSASSPPSRSTAARCATGSSGSE